LGRFARSIATISIVLRVYEKLIINRWIDHLQDHPMGRNPDTLVHVLGALHPRSGVAIGRVQRKSQTSSAFKCKGARIILFMPSVAGTEEGIIDPPTTLLFSPFIKKYICTRKLLTASEYCGILSIYSK
jgi:hypothetical protein